MKHLLLLALAFGLVAAGLSQTPEPGKLNKSDEIQLKIRQVDLLIKILPLAMTKEQIKDLLPGIEKARDEQRKILKLEDEQLAKLDAEVSEALKKGLEGTYPPRELQQKVASVTNGLAVHRQITLNNQADDLWAKLDKVLNAGQKKAMIGSFAPSFIAPDRKAEDVTDEMKRRFFIKFVFLDPIAYDLLVKLSSAK